MPAREDRFRFEWLQNALEDISRLIQMRWGGQVPEGQRDMFLLHYACLAAQLHKPERLMQVLRDFAARFLDERFARKHMMPSLKTLLRRAEQTAAGKRSTWQGKSLTRVYTYSKERIIHELGITLEEMSDLRGLVDETIRNTRKVEAKKASRRAAGVRPHEKYLADSLSQERPWEALGISRATYYRRRKAKGRTTPEQRETSLTPTLSILAKPDGSPGRSPLCSCDFVCKSVLIPFQSAAKVQPLPDESCSRALPPTRLLPS